MAERILVLGTTGVNKSKALSQLEKYIHSQGITVTYKIVDFDEDFLKPVIEENGKDYFSYLDDTNLRQRQLWLEAWKRFIPDENSEKFQDRNKEQNIILTLHGVLTREFTGTRSLINIQNIIDFAPTKIVTLIDDVYSKWHRTHERAKGERRRGQPTLEQLLDARRSEIFIGDIIAGHQKVKPRHYILSIQHPARTLYRLLFGIDTRTVYLSFPISGPRKLLKTGDTSGFSEVNEFIKKVNEFESANQKIACFCPLAIDELPLLNDLPAITDKKEEEKYTVGFSLKEKRWDVRNFWKDEILLCEDCPSTIAIPLKQVKEASGFIQPDVRLRDYRLVNQARYVLVFNPWFKGEETGGVRNEIKIATIERKSVYIFQDPRHDNNGDAEKSLSPSEGTLGIDPGSLTIKFFGNVDDALRQILI